MQSRNPDGYFSFNPEYRPDFALQSRNPSFKDGKSRIPKNLPWTLTVVYVALVWRGKNEKTREKGWNGKVPFIFPPSRALPPLSIPRAPQSLARSSSRLPKAPPFLFRAHSLPPSSPLLLPRLLPQFPFSSPLRHLLHNVKEQWNMNLLSESNSR